MEQILIYRKAVQADVIKLSILFKHVYIQTYGIDGVSDEFAHFIEKQFAPERLSQLILQHRDAIIVAAYNDNLVGVVELAFDKKCPVGNFVAPELSKLYILEWFCGKGIGYHLLAEAEKVLVLKGFTEMWLWVLITNQRAISFYERQNFQCIGNAPFQMEQNSYDNKVMWKQLTVA